MWPQGRPRKGLRAHGRGAVRAWSAVVPGLRGRARPSLSGATPSPKRGPPTSPPRSQTARRGTSRVGSEWGVRGARPGGPTGRTRWQVQRPSRSPWPVPPRIPGRPLPPGWLPVRAPPARERACRAALPACAPSGAACNPARLRARAERVLAPLKGQAGTIRADPRRRAPRTCRRRPRRPGPRVPRAPRGLPQSRQRPQRPHRAARTDGAGPRTSRVMRRGRRRRPAARPRRARALT